MKTCILSGLGLGLSALLLGGCLQTDDAAADKHGRPRPQPAPPVIFLATHHAALDYGCSVDSIHSPGDCLSPFPPGDVIQVSAMIDWFDPPFGPAFGANRITDDCGGAFTDVVNERLSIEGTWHAPPVETVCTMTVEAVGVNGAVLSSAAITFDVSLNRPPPPLLGSLILRHDSGTCNLSELAPPGVTEVACDPVLASGNLVVDLEIHGGSDVPGTIELSDTCDGEFDVIEDYFENGTSVLLADWRPQAGAGSECTLIVDALSPDNDSYSFRMHVPLI